MSQEIFLISPNSVKKATNISNNVDEKYLNSAIREAQDVNLQMTLGTKLLDKVKNLVKSGDISATTNEDYKTLLDDHIYYFLLYQVVSTVVPLVAIKINNIGVTQNSDEHNDALSYNNIMKLRELYLGKAAFYNKRLIEFLKENKDKYPELKENKDTDIQPQKSADEVSSIFLGGNRRRIRI